MKSKIVTVEQAKQMAKSIANQDTISTNERKSIFESLITDIEKINPELGGFEELSTLLSLPEDHFNLLAPIFLDELQKSMNNASDTLFLAQALNASGNTIEDLREVYNQVMDQIDTNFSEAISQSKRDFLKRLLSITYNATAEAEGIAKRIIQIPIELCHPNAKIPTYANLGDAGLDIYALEDITIAPGETKLIPTGIKIAIPHGYEVQVRPKSGRALRTKLRVANTPGTIDTGYRDEIKVIIENIEPPIKDISYDFDDNGNINITSIHHGSSYTIGAGEKFAQLVLCESPKISFFEVENIQMIDGDRQGGFGSSSIYHKEDKRYGSDVAQQEG